MPAQLRLQRDPDPGRRPTALRSRRRRKEAVAARKRIVAGREVRQGRGRGVARIPAARKAGGDLGFFPRGTMDPAFEDAVVRAQARHAERAGADQRSAGTSSRCWIATRCAPRPGPTASGRTGRADPRGARAPHPDPRAAHRRRRRARPQAGGSRLQRSPQGHGLRGAGAPLQPLRRQVGRRRRHRLRGLRRAASGEHPQGARFARDRAGLASHSRTRSATTSSRSRIASPSGPTRSTRSSKELPQAVGRDQAARALRRVGQDPALQGARRDPQHVELLGRRVARDAPRLC